MSEPDASDLSAEIPLAGTFPLPFRVLFLGGLGIIGWAVNLHGLQLSGIDAVSALDLQTSDQAPLPLAAGTSLNAPVYEPIYRLATTYCSWIFGTWSLYRLMTGGQDEQVDEWKFVPALAMIGAFGLLCAPVNAYRRERDSFLLALRRCVFPPRGRPIFFSDVIMADILTSYAKVLGDVWLSLCMLFPGGSLHVLPSLQGLSRWVLPTIMSWPYALRLRQCLIEYGAAGNTNRRQLYNALKYATAFPVIYLSAAQRIVASDLAADRVEADIAWNVEHRIFSFWLFFATVNSLYSFWWDVTNDWGLDLLVPKSTPSSNATKRQSIPRPLILPARHDKSLEQDRTSAPSTPTLSSRETTQSPYPWGLRRILRYPLPVYPLLIFLNLVLRLTWSIKLSSHLHTNESAEGSLVILWLEVLELLRRWAWVFLRVEWEVVRRGDAIAQGIARGVAPEAGEEYELVFRDEEVDADSRSEGRSDPQSIRV